MVKDPLVEGAVAVLAEVSVKVLLVNVDVQIAVTPSLMNWLYHAFTKNARNVEHR